MMLIERRQAMQLLGAAGLSGLLPFAAGAAGDGTADALRHVAPELRDAARAILADMARTGPLTAARLPQMRAAPPPTPAAPLRADVPVSEHRVPVPGQRTPVTVYVVNARPGTPRPAILHMHGGGYVLGTAKSELAFLQDVARAVDCVIATVDYTLAPEARYTVSVDQNHAALRWLHDGGAALGVDRGRIAVMGESAGGGHAALLAIAARDRGQVPLVLQVLTYPMLDDRTGSTRSVPPFIGALVWNPAANRLGWGSFLGAAPGGPAVPAAGVPARVASVAGLPPALIAVGGIDLFVQEDIAYAQRLTEAGIPTELHVTPGAFHAFDRIVPQAAASQAFAAVRTAALQRAFARPPG